MNVKGKIGGEDDTATPADVRHPLSMSKDDPTYVDWREVGRFDPHAPRFLGEVPASVETRPVSEGLDMVRRQRRAAEVREQRRKKAMAAADEVMRGSTLANLYARGTLDDRRMRAGLAFREKRRISTGGVAAADWMREKVDGGRLFVGPEGGLTSALDADRQIREWLARSGMGILAAEVVLRVAGDDEQLKTVACDFEDSEEACIVARAELQPTRDAQGYVRRLLRDGLAALADHLYGRERRAARLLPDAVRDWLTIDRAR